MTREKYVVPELEKPAFTCPLCGVYANVVWKHLLTPGVGTSSPSGTVAAYCAHCRKPTIWFREPAMMIWPQIITTAPLPNPDMPEDIQKDYAEARSIMATSARGAAALLRLSVQKLCRHLGEAGDNLSADIGNLVKKGLPVQIQKALDIVRVTGNNAVHPGEMQIQEEQATVSLLFDLVNMIIENQISQPKAVEALYSRLPSGAVEAIKKRDGSADNTMPATR